MADDNTTNLVDIPENLADFKAIFDSKDAPVEVEDTEDDTLATDEDTDASEEDDASIEEDSEVPDEDSDTSENPDEDTSEEEEPEPEPQNKSKKQKSRYQERINELTRTAREAQRREAQTLQRLEALEAEARKSDTPQENIRQQLPPGAPTPDAVDKNGEAVYPLGEFDPLFIRDLTKFTITEETKALKEQTAREAAARSLAAEQNALKANWAEKLDKAEEETPEIREHISELVETFQDVEPSYGEYLATTIMQCDNGPAIMEYLSQNIGEAQKIVASGPHAATLAIGRLEAKLERLARPDADEKRNKKISGAVTPPLKVNKGNRGQSSVRPDTNDLAAFKREYFK